MSKDKKIDLDAIAAKFRKALGQSKAGDSKFIKFQEGSNLIRLLPPKDEDGNLFVKVVQHKLPDSGDGKFSNVHCLNTEDKDNCPLCRLYKMLWKTKSKDDEDLARKIKPTPRYFMNVVDRTDNKVKIFAAPPTLFEIIVNVLGDKNDPMDLFDLEKGHDFNVIMGFNGSFPKYTESRARPKMEPAGTPKQISEYMDSLHNLSELSQLKTYDEVKKLAISITPDHLLARMENLRD